MYKLTVHYYSTNKKVEQTLDSYAQAVNAAVLLATVIPIITPLTRSKAIDGVVNHMDKYFDLYNELAIIVKPIL